MAVWLPASCFLVLLLNINLCQAQCSPDPNCFCCKGGCAISSAQPYERTTTNCEECQQKCLSHQGGAGGAGTITGARQYTCATFVYDATYMTCDLYAVGPSRAHPLVSYSARMTCAPRPGCNAGPGPGPEPTLPCPAGMAPVYYRTEATGYQNGSPIEVPGLSVDQCMEACNSGLSPDGGTFSCAAFVTSGSNCLLYDTASQPKGTGTLRPDPAATYHERVCLPEATVANCGKLFDRVPQYVLTGFATDVITVGSFDECMAACLASSNCLSGMFYYESPTADGNCILNDGSRDTNPELYGPDAFGDLVDYFQPDCNRRGRDTGFVSKRYRMKLSEQALQKLRADIFRDDKSLQKGMRDSGSLLDKWTTWSPCDVEHNRRVRYKMCAKKDIRKCPAETKQCQLLDASELTEFLKLQTAKGRVTESTGRPVARRFTVSRPRATTGRAAPKPRVEEATPCRCLIDARGRLDCRVGIMHRVVDGKRLTQYCANPRP